MFPVSPASPEAVSPSSSVLWAQPSKEWVIPAKPKPGRKPKKQASTSIVTSRSDVDDEPSGSRRLQNRAAQRAFRERKQTQLVELQARLHSYEQGEIERNVALQNVAKKMKEENDDLRKENQMLRDKIAVLEQERDELVKDRRRACSERSTSSSSFPAVGDNSTRKRARVDDNTQDTLPPLLHPSIPASSSSLSCPSEDAPSAAAFPAREPEGHSQQSMFPTPPPTNNVVSFTTTNETTGALEGQNPMESYTCILCSPDAPCLCKELTIQQAVSDSTLHQIPVQSESLDQQPLLSLGQPAPLDAPPSTGVSLLDNLPAFQAPVPIRRRTGTSRANAVFPVTPMAATTSLSASKCSGDPDNCMACADDSFGKAFCQAIGHKVNTTLPCTDCPKRTSETGEILVGGCCGDITKCGSCGIAPIISSTTTPQRNPETIPTDDAWRQLKSHPNVAFADLSLLAEVVARRSKCTGSRVVISPAPGAATPDHTQLSHHEPNLAIESQDQSVLLTDPHEHFRQKQQQRESPPRLVPQHVLIECGRRRVREVNADGVREALRLLDQKFAHMR